MKRFLVKLLLFAAALLHSLAFTLKVKRVLRSSDG